MGDIIQSLLFGIGGSAIINSFKRPEPDPQQIAIRDTVAPRYRGYGRFKLESVLDELKVENPTGDGILHVASMLHTGEIDAIEELKFNDQITRFDPGTGLVTYPGVWNDSSRVAVHVHLGTDDQTADSFLTTAFPGRWTAEHRLRGIAYVAAKFNGVPLEDFSTVYQAGEPKCSAIGRLSKVFDPRDVAQDIDDPTTWTWTTNAALIIMDYLWHRDGMRLPRSMILAAVADWIAAADICDEEVELIGGGTEPRYQLCGTYALPASIEPRKDTLRAMEACIDGFVYFKADASISIQVGAFVEPTDDETFGPADILEYRGLRRGPPKTELRNDVRAIYTSPGHKFLPQEADPWRAPGSIDLDGEQTTTLQMRWSPSHSQTRRMMKVASYRLNPEWQGQIVTNARGRKLRNKRYARFIIPELGIDLTFYINTAEIDLLSGACTFDVVAFPSEAFDWDPTEEGESPEFDSPGNWGRVVPAGVTSLAITADSAGGGGTAADGGDGGARSVKTIAIDPADVGQVILFTVARRGQGDPLSTDATDGGDTTVTGTLTAGAINILCTGGNCNNSGDGPGIATGGDTNTNGSSSAGGDGGQAGSGASENEFPGGGGHEGDDAANGSVTFDWTYA